MDGPVPQVATDLSGTDLLGTIGARTGFTRNNYKVSPGLYCTGEPTAISPVLVTANYKLSFDALRRELKDLSTWILVVDTRGINVWCAAGKGTFSEEEISYQINRCQLKQIVSHRKVILPQLCANGVTAHKLKKLSGFHGTFGPILSSRLPEFLKKEGADNSMRMVSFNLAERAVLIPLEICMLWKPLLIYSIVCFIVSGFSTEFYSVTTALTRGSVMTLATLTGIVTGAGLTPLLLPWIPCRQFWLKGALIGAVAASVFLGLIGPSHSSIDKTGLFLWISCLASYLAMNFTGSTPFTSLSGVAKEMRKGLPFQIICAVLSLTLWLAGPFVHFG